MNFPRERGQVRSHLPQCCWLQSSLVHKRRLRVKVRGLQSSLQGPAPHDHFELTYSVLSTLLIPLQPRGPPSSCFLSFLLLPLQGFCTYFLCLECSSPRHTQLIPSGLYINIIFSVGPCLATYNRLKIWPRWWYITILWQHHDVQA